MELPGKLGPPVPPGLASVLTPAARVPCERTHRAHAIAITEHMSLSKMPSTTTLPTTSLKRLTLYKNQLAFTERTAKLTDGLKSANQHSFSLSVPDTTRELTMATLSTVVPGANVAVMVAHDEPGTSAQHKATEPQPYEFVLGAGVGLGNFLASVIGAEVTVSMHDGSTLTGQVLLVEEAQRAVPGSENSSESVVERLPWHHHGHRQSERGLTTQLRYRRPSNL